MAAILLGDEDPEVRFALGMLLREAGHEILEADRCSAVLETAAEKRPDLVVTDVNMAGMSGVELIEQLRKARPGIPVIAMTGGGMHQTPDLAATLAANAGADRVLQKPFGNDELIAEVSTLLSGTGGSDPERDS
ncbi:MAG: response regulator [Gemmatimonadetes bacterium]|nr:response regulator [Gemmatimonadota bacterium]